MGTPQRLGDSGEHTLPLLLDDERQLYHAEELELESAGERGRTFRRRQGPVAEGIGKLSAVRSQPSDTGGTEKKPGTQMDNRLFLESEVLVS